MIKCFGLAAEMLNMKMHIHTHFDDILMLAPAGNGLLIFKHTPMFPKLMI